MLPRIAALIACASVASAQNAALERIHRLLAPLRSVRVEHTDRSRGATPAFNAVKRELRDWIESRLPAVRGAGDFASIAREWNRELGAADLLCDGRCGMDDAAGYLNEIALERPESSLLLVRTRVSILCGDDESVYAYRLGPEGWKRIFQSEQNDYAEGRYFPQTIHRALIAGDNVLTVGRNPWCSSNWYSVYHRLWHGSNLLVDKSEVAWVGSEDFVQARLTEREAVIRYWIAGFGGYNRSVVYRYAIEQGKATRSDPVALRPVDFVHFWLTGTWDESARWSERDDLRRGHREYRSPSFGVTRHCAARPDLWQVTLDTEAESVYFLVGWRPPYRFTMVDAADRPWSDCAQEDREADEVRALFP